MTKDVKKVELLARRAELEALELYTIKRLDEINRQLEKLK